MWLCLSSVDESVVDGVVVALSVGVHAGARVVGSPSRGTSLVGGG